MELLTRNQFMKRYNIGYDKMQKMIANNEVDYLPIADRIRIDENTVSIDQYNRIYQRMVEAEATIRTISNLTKEREVNVR
ncbi:MAG: hypothetical protein IKE01_06440 [Clostridia bacterium]|nr:hypothetical protein [Clostridia bacterium]